MGLRPIEITIDNQNSFTFLLRRYKDQDYLYGFTTCTKDNNQHVKFREISHQARQATIGYALIFGNVIHNLYDKCVKVIFYQIATVFSKDKALTEDQKIAKRMWEHKTPPKALVAAVAQLALNLLSVIAFFFSFGHCSQQINWLSGDIERWTLGDSKDDINSVTRNGRYFRSFMRAGCQQPLFALPKLKKGMINLSDIDITNTIRARLKKIIRSKDEFTSIRNAEKEEKLAKLINERELREKKHAFEALKENNRKNMV